VRRRCWESADEELLPCSPPVDATVRRECLQQPSRIQRREPVNIFAVSVSSRKEAFALDTFSSGRPVTTISLNEHRPDRWLSQPEESLRLKTRFPDNSAANASSADISPCTPGL